MSKKKAPKSFQKISALLVGDAMNPARFGPLKTFAWLCLPIAALGLIVVLKPIFKQKSVFIEISSSKTAAQNELDAISALANQVRISPNARVIAVSWPGDYQERAYLEYRTQERHLWYRSGCNGTCPISPNFEAPVSPQLLTEAAQKRWDLYRLDLENQKNFN